MSGADRDIHAAQAFAKGAKAMIAHIARSIRDQPSQEHAERQARTFAADCFLQGWHEAMVARDEDEL